MIHTTLEDNWQWIEEVDGSVLASITASPLHNRVVFIERIEINDKDAGAGMRVGKAFMQECFLRGYTAFITMMSPKREQERRLLNVMIKRYGCFVSKVPFVLVSGSTLLPLSGDQIKQLEEIMCVSGYVS